MVSVSDLAPYPHSNEENENPPNTDYTLLETEGAGGADVQGVAVDEAVDDVRCEVENDEDPVPEKTDSEPALPRRSTRRRKAPDRYGFNVVYLIFMSFCYGFNFVKFEWERSWIFVCYCLATMIARLKSATAARGS